MFQQFEVRKLQIAITIFFLELNFQKHEFYARRTLTFWWKLQRQREGKFIMLTDSAQTVLAVVFTVLIITDIVGNTLVCVVLIKNQDMRWVSTRTFQLLRTYSNFLWMRFFAISRTSQRPSCFSLPLVGPVKCVLEH